jgi:hypothetical protein
MVKNKIRPLGNVTADLEPLLEELTDAHGLQWHEVLALVHAWLQVHAQHARETYTSGGHPEYSYAPKK